MKKIVSICSMILFLTVLIKAQGHIDIVVSDVNDQPLIGATAVLLSQPDSIMTAFGITNEKGQCSMEKIDTGEYVLQVSYIGHSNHSESIYLPDTEGKVSKNITLTESSELLNEVTIKAEHIPMGIIGDTISYNAAAFKTRPGASVEDLLKKLPGIEVDRGGNIKAQGEDVEKVLVDGKEFFGDDPLIATKNLDAEAVEKVQVFDKASEIAEFTGIDDGQEEKTINLQLKEGHKSGGFGKVTAEGGTEDTWLGKVNYNRFSPSMQAAFIGSGNNVNQQSFSMNEYISFMGGLGNAIANGGFSMYGNQSNQEGVNTNYSIGTNFNYDFSNKLKLYSNYFYLNNTLDLNKTIAGENFGQGFSYNSTDTLHRDANNQNHKLNTKLKYSYNPLTEFVFKNNILSNENNSNNSSQSKFENVNQPITSNSSDQHLLADRWGYESQFQVKRKFLKKGRNWISTASYKNNSVAESNDILNLYSMNTAQFKVDQLQDYYNDQRDIFFTSDYTEPLGNKTYLGLNYSYNENTETPTKDFYDRMSNGILAYNSDLSSLFEKRYTYHSTGLKLKKITRKIKTNIGANIQATQLVGVIGNDVETIQKSFTHLLPSMSLNIDVSRGKKLELNYFTQITAPTLSQLLPIQDNSDPNILIEGNPSLIPVYNHMIGANYNMFDQFEFISFFANAQISYAKNQIVNQVSIDENFVQKLSPINSNRFVSANGHLSYSRPIRWLKTKIRFDGNFNYANYISFLNTTENLVKENTINFSTSMSNRNTDFVYVSAGFRLEHNTRSYSINKDFNQQFFNYDWFIESDFYISESLTITTEFDYKKYADASFSESQSFSLWNASITKTFFENRYSVSLKAHDILNQNIGLRRSSTTNGLHIANYNTLGRYVMLGVTMKLKGKGVKGESTIFNE